MAAEEAIIGGSVLGLIRLAIGAIISLVIYFLPFIIALMRNHSQKVAIFFLDLFLGWSFVGWVVALVWSFIKEKNNTPQ